MDWPADESVVRVAVAPGQEVVVHELGAGHPLCCLPGLGADHTAFAPNVRSLALRHRCLVVDQVGIGASSPVTGPLTMARLADDVARVIAERTEGAADVLGVSMGGMVAQHLALRHPDRVRHLVLGCTGPGGPAAERADPAVTRQLLGGDARDPVTAYRNACRVMYSEEFQAQHPEVIDGAVEWRAHHLVRGQTFRAQWDAIRGHATGDDLPRINAPTLVLHGTHDRVMPPGNGAVLAARIPGATLEWFEGRGHLFFQEDPEATSERLGGWLGAQAPGPRGSA